jgi:hypothetical protein
VGWIGLLICAALAYPAILFIARAPRQAHANSWKKALFLWFFTTTPVFAALVLSQPGEDASGHILDLVLTTVSFNEIFVYTASFASPIIYSLVEVVSKFSRVRTMNEVRVIVRQMRFIPVIAVFAFVLLLITLLAFGIAKANPDEFPKTVMAQLFTDRGWVVYVVSLLFWYCAILIEQDEGVDFEKKAKSESQKFAEAFEKRKAAGP